MNVLIITNKPAQSEALLRSIQRVNPWPGAMVTVIPTILDGLFRFDYPTELRAADLPYVGDVRLRPGSLHAMQVGQGWLSWRGICGDQNAAWAAGRNELKPWKEGFLYDADLGTRLSDPDTIKSTLCDLIGSSGLVVKLNDPHYRDAVAFADIMATRQCNLDLGYPVVLQTHVASLAQSDLDAIVSTLALDARDNDRVKVGTRPWRSDGAHETFGRGKNFFDYNWAVNTSALLASALQEAGVPSLVSARPIVWEPIQATTLLSKYVLLMLFHLAGNGHMTWTDNTAITTMSHWMGTGKYPSSHSGAEVGSNISRCAILENLRRLGLVAYDSPSPLVISPWLGDSEQDPALAELLRLARGMLDGSEVHAGKSVRDWLVLSGSFRSDPDGNHGMASCLPPGHHMASRLADNVSSTSADFLSSPVDAEACAELGILRRPNPRVLVTPKGHRLVELLPKSAYDPDLPFRLHEWCEAWPESRPRMAAYIKRYFGNIKRANGMRALAAGGGEVQECAMGLLERTGDLQAAARAAQVSVAVLEAAVAGSEVSAAQTRAIVLAAGRVVNVSPATIQGTV